MWDVPIGQPVGSIPRGLGSLARSSILCAARLVKRDEACGVGYTAKFLNACNAFDEAGMAAAAKNYRAH
jgi:hypothetical protein